MGWTSEPKGNRSTLTVLVDDVQSSGWWVVLDTHRDRDRSTYYLLAEHGPGNPGYSAEDPQRTIFVALTETVAGMREPWISHKIMGEGMGPYKADAPVRWLDTLPETDSDYARDWREQCRESARQRASRPKLVHGERVRFPDARYRIPGHDPDHDPVFVVVRTGRRVRFKVEGSGGIYNLNGYTQQRIVAAEEVTA